MLNGQNGAHQHLHHTDHSKPYATDYFTPLRACARVVIAM